MVNSGVVNTVDTVVGVRGESIEEVGIVENILDIDNEQVANLLSFIGRNRSKNFRGVAINYYYSTKSSALQKAAQSKVLIQLN